jgi:hypothetical protein
MAPNLGPTMSQVCCGLNCRCRDSSVAEKGTLCQAKSGEEGGIQSGLPWPSPFGQLRCADRQSWRSVERAASHPPYSPYENAPRCGGVLRMAERVGFNRAFPGPHPSGSFAVQIGNPADLSNARLLIHPIHHTKTPPDVGAFCVWRRGWDSNPRCAMNARLISSQVQSTTLPPLRWAANHKGCG